MEAARRNSRVLENLVLIVVAGRTILNIIGFLLAMISSVRADISIRK